MTPQVRGDDKLASPTPRRNDRRESFSFVPSDKSPSEWLLAVQEHYDELNAGWRRDFYSHPANQPQPIERSPSPFSDACNYIFGESSDDEDQAPGNGEKNTSKNGEGSELSKDAAQEQGNSECEEYKPHHNRANLLHRTRTRTRTLPRVSVIDFFSPKNSPEPSTPSVGSVPPPTPLLLSPSVRGTVDPHNGKTDETPGEKSPEKTTDNMAYETANILEYVTTSSKKKKKNKGKKKRKGGSSASRDPSKFIGAEDKLESSMFITQKEPTVLSSLELSKQPEKPQETSAVPLEGNQVSQPQDTSEFVDNQPHNSSETEIQPLIGESQVLSEKKKGKSRVPVAHSAEETDASVQLRPPQALPIRLKPETHREVSDVHHTSEMKVDNDSKSDIDTGNPPSTPSCQRTHKKTISTKERLPAICELGAEGQGCKSCDEPPISPAGQDHLSSEAQSVPASTPKSTTTGSTEGFSLTTVLTPQTTGPSEPSTKGTSHRNGQNSNTGLDMTASSIVSASVSSSSQVTSHSHPKTSAPGVARRRTVGQKPDNFFWQLDSHGFACAKVDCDARCNLWDGSTVICPGCGPYSEVRYCSKEHLFKDIKLHWMNCGHMYFKHPCRESTIPHQVREGPPLIPCIHNYDMIERHRQAVYFNMNTRKGDYFIFSDWVDKVNAGLPEDDLHLRCSSRIIKTIEFTDSKEKDRFRRVLAACLFLTVETHELVDYLYRLIRDKLRARSRNDDLESALRYQLKMEFGVVIQPYITGERHACETDWTGANRRNCEDEICRSEIQRLLGKLGGQGHSHALDHLEAQYWILRAARTTHPEVKDAELRMRGEGFQDVPPEDRRNFRRGVGWDGAGSGDMEIEGINDA